MGWFQHLAFHTTPSRGFHVAHYDGDKYFLMFVSYRYYSVVIDTVDSVVRCVVMHHNLMTFTVFLPRVGLVKNVLKIHVPRHHDN